VNFGNGECNPLKLPLK
jgi:hypothetical protein